MSVTYTAVLDVSEDSVLFLSGLLHAERIRRGTRTDTRALGTYKQAVLALRWLFDDTRISQLARDNGIGLSTAYDYRDEAIGVLADRKPSLHGALLAAKAAGHTHVILDGTLIPTDRISTPGPTRGVDLWWSGKHHHHGGNIQAVSAPDGWPLWTSDVRPGREHDTTAARADTGLLAQITAWVDDGRHGLADLGYEGEADLLTIPIKKPAGGALTPDQQAYNAVTVHCAASANVPTPCSRPPSRRYAAGAAVPGASAGSSPPRSSCSTTNTTAQHDPYDTATHSDQQVARKASVSRHTALAVLVIWRPVSPRPSARSTAAGWRPRP